MIAVVLIDDHPLVREGIRGMLRPVPDITVTGDAASGPEGVGLVARERPDIALMDLRMPGGDGVEAIRQIVRTTTTRVIVVTTYEADEDIIPAVEAGAVGYLLKDITPDELADAIRAAHRGDTVLARSAQRALMSRLHHTSVTTPALSEQERTVLAHVAQGMTNAAIGNAMHVSEATVKTYLSRAYDKLTVNDRSAAVAKAIKLGLID